MNQNYSASRFGTFNSCLLKYKLTYIDDLVVTGREFSVQKKGLVFHHIAEGTSIDETWDALNERAKKEIAESGMTEAELEKYPIEKAIPVFYAWWKAYIQDAWNNGYTRLFKEKWEKGTIDGEPLVGALDVLLVNERFENLPSELVNRLIDEGKAVKDGECLKLLNSATEEDVDECKEKGTDKSLFIIADYKSGSSPKLSEDYKNQLLLYVYMLSQQRGIPLEEITSRFKCYLFYPLASIKGVDVEDDAAVDKLMRKNTLRFDFTLRLYEDALSHFSEIVRQTKERDWAGLNPLVDANLSFSCSFCAFCGHPRYCKLSYDSGLTFPRSAKVMTKEELKASHGETN
jgi:RecB family exonuclease